MIRVIIQNRAGFTLDNATVNGQTDTITGG